MAKVIMLDIPSDDRFYAIVGECSDCGSLVHKPDWAHTTLSNKLKNRALHIAVNRLKEIPYLEKPAPLYATCQHFDVDAGNRIIKRKKA